MNRMPLSFARNERGATLVVSLVFLVVITMLGITVANVSILEERMAGGTRDRELALQSAEAALRDAEIRLGTDVFRANFPAITFVATNANNAAYWETCFTTAIAPCDTKFTPALSLPTTGTGALALPPEFIVERKPNFGPAPTQVYRVTARSVGGTPDAIVILQAEFAYTPPSP
jgi:type IV pilus assembly protein PilX